MLLRIVITLANMARTPESTTKNAIIALVVLCIFIVTPRSLAEDLLSPILGTVDAPAESPSPTPSVSPIPIESASPDPVASPTIDPIPTANPSTSAHSHVLIASDSPTATASATPVPPHAIAEQDMQIGVPTVVSTDPRAHSVFLPFMHVGKVDTLLVCGYSNSAGIYFTPGFPGVLSSGSGSSYFKISGPAPSVMAALNGDMGARVVATSKAVSSSIVSLSFIALSKPSIDQALCSDGSPSNNRTITFRALSMDLNMVKDPVTLK